MTRFPVLLAWLLLPGALLAQKKKTEKETPVSVEPLEQTISVPDYSMPIDIVESNGKFGVYSNTSKQWLIPAAYENIQFTADSLPYFVVRDNGNYGVLDVNGKVMIGFDYQWLTFYNISSKSRNDRLSDKDYVFGVQKNGLFGFINIYNKQLVPPEYTKIRYDEYGPEYSALKDGKWGVVSLNGQVKVPFQYDEMDPLEKNIYQVSANNLKGVIAKDGKILLPIQYTKIVNLMSDVKEYRSRYVITGVDGKEGVWDSKINLDIPARYDKIVNVRDDNFVVVTGKKYGLINSQNKVQVPFEYDLLRYFTSQKNNRLLLAVQKGKYGLIDVLNKKLINFEYDDLQSISAGLYKAGNNGKWKVIDSTGRSITKPEYDNIGVFVEGTAAVFKNGQMGMINTAGQEKQFTTPDGGGYTDIKKLLHDFVDALNSKNDSILTAFCKKVAPDGHTVSFLRKSGFKYRTLLHDLDKKAYTLEDLPGEYLFRLKRFCRLLDNKIPSWKLECTDQDLDIHLRSDIYCAESVTIAWFGTGGKDIKIRMGDLTRIDGFWKSFSLPDMSDNVY